MVTDGPLTGHWTKPEKWHEAEWQVPLSWKLIQERTAERGPHLPKAVREAIIANKITSNDHWVDNPIFKYVWIVETVVSKHQKADAEDILAAVRQDHSRLAEEAGNAVGDRPGVRTKA
jgi:hypothetical protein